MPTQEQDCKWCKGSGRIQECKGDPVFKCPDCYGTGKAQICDECGEVTELCNCPEEEE